MKKWNGLLTILEIEHRKSNGQIVWQDKNLKNKFHTSGEEYMLKAVFGDVDIPSFYYLGLDGRSSLDVSDTMTDIVDEPSTNGYLRQSVDSTGWSVELTNGVNRAISPIVTYVASGGSWGPVENLFLTNKADNSGYLISSVKLNASASLDFGDNISMRLGLSLQELTDELTD